MTHVGSSPDTSVSITFVFFDSLHKPIGSSEAGPRGLHCATFADLQLHNPATQVILDILKCGGPATLVGIERSGATTYMTIPNNSTPVQYVLSGEALIVVQIFSPSNET